MINVCCVRPWSALALLFCGFSLVACGDSEQQDIRQWMNESAKGLTPKITPVPSVSQIEMSEYLPGDLLSPFSQEKLLADELNAKDSTKTGGPAPVNTDAHPLTRFPLESFRLVGTMLIGDQQVAVLAGGDTPRKARVGDLIGQNYGRITAIRVASGDLQGEVLVKEKIFERGVWVARESRIGQQPQGDKK